jgi:hypothetical protein
MSHKLGLYMSIAGPISNRPVSRLLQVNYFSKQTFRDKMWSDVQHHVIGSLDKTVYINISCTASVPNILNDAENKNVTEINNR